MSVTNVSSASVEGEKSKTALPPPPIDLLTCQPDELASWLNNHRFQNNAMEVASFLLTCTSSLPNAEDISAQLMGNDAPSKEETKEEEPNRGDYNDEDASTFKENNNLGEASTTISSHEVSCINPRGRFNMSLHSNGIKLKNPKKNEEEIIITKESVENVVWFRKPEDYKSLKQVKEGSKKPIPGHIVLICLGGDHDIIFRKKAIKQICLQLPSYPAPSMETDEDTNAQDWNNGLKSSLLSEDKVMTRVLSTVDAPSSNSKGGYTFKAGVGGPGNTSTTTAGMPFVGCNRGFNNGALFPLREGLLFFKPPLFVPRSNLASISCGRGSGQSRFVDMVVQLDDDDDSTLEFTNIEREELQGLNEYIHNVLIPAMKRDASQGSGNNQDESSDEDEEVAMAEVVDSSADDCESDDSAAITKRKSSRAASKSARESTRAHFAALNGQEEDDDEDDSDVESFSGGEGGHSSDESDEESDAEMSGSEELNESEEEEEEESDESNDDDSFEDGRSSKKAKFDR